MPSSSYFYLYTENLSLLVLLPIFAYKKDTCQNLPVSLLYFVKITHLYSIKGIGISSVQTSFPYIMMIWKQWQPADMVKLSDFSPFRLCDLPFNRFAFKIISFFKKTYHAVFRTSIFFLKNPHIFYFCFCEYSICARHSCTPAAFASSAGFPDQQRILEAPIHVLLIKFYYM